jgi:hypothetical protein
MIVGKSINSKLCIMKRNKLFSAAILLLLLAFITTSWVSSTPAPKKTQVSITVPFYWAAGAPPNVTFTGHFTMTGAIEAEGEAIMVAAINANGMVYHCIWTLTFGNGDIITLHEQCEMGSTPVKGRWEIVGGTGDYKDLRGNGSALMPDVGNVNIYEEDLTGVIYSK